MALTREDVITKAVELLDEVGLQGLTLRRLARELGISAPTLYWHVRDKRELLDLMGDRIVGDYRKSLPPMPANLEWWEIIAESLRRQYHALIAHRDGALVVAGNRPTEDSLPMIDKWLGFWLEAGFPPEEALSTVLAGDNYVMGSALEYQAESERARLHKNATGPHVKDKEAYPNLKRAIEARHAAGGKDPEEIFERGLSLFIAGVRARREALLSGASDKTEAPAS